MGCGVSKPETKVDRAPGKRRRRKVGVNDFSTLDEPSTPTGQMASIIPPADNSQSNAPQTTLAAPKMTIEAKKFSINPVAPIVAHTTAQPHAQQPNAPVEPPKSGPITGAIDPGKKVTLRQTVQLAIQIARQQREKVGKFRRDERHCVMELYELMGLETDAPIAPQSEFQAQLSAYSYPPENMHMLRDMPVIDEQTVISVLGEHEYNRRKNEGSVSVAPMKANQNSAAPRRAGVSAEVTRDVARPLNFFKSRPKTREQTESLSNAIRKTILFRGLDTSELQMLFNAFECEEFAEGATIFEKGDEGDRFYLIESGRCQIILTDDDGAEKGSVFVGADDTFGELGVMYGTPRAATVIAVLPTSTWWIDRDTYRGLLLVQTIKKRERFTTFLRSVDIFSSIDDYERARIADVLDVMEVPAGTVIVREGEPGESFYMIEEGVVDINTSSKGHVGSLGPGKVFGELALLFDKPRQATVRATTPVRMCVLGRANFVNYMGPFENILRRNADQYKRVLQSASN